ncbi:hypothetical protein EDD86DRAFT_246390 [Gorgonomyces haynaldii]|nr:hypothetical protein EDD86DRAFT_246390 [Gorgonomyces haynaldii]
MNPNTENLVQALDEDFSDLGPWTEEPRTFLDVDPIVVHNTEPRMNSYQARILSRMQEQSSCPDVSDSQGNEEDQEYLRNLVRLHTAQQELLEAHQQLIDARNELADFMEDLDLDEEDEDDNPRNDYIGGNPWIRIMEQMGLGVVGVGVNEDGVVVVRLGRQQHAETMLDSDGNTLPEFKHMDQDFIVHKCLESLPDPNSDSAQSSPRVSVAKRSLDR